MSIPEVVNNAGNLFNADDLAQLPEQIGDEELLRSQFDQVREQWDRRASDIDEEASANAVGFFFLNRVFHVLGYTHSHREELPSSAERVDFTLFESPDDFLAHVTGRGTSQLFAGALAVARAIGWAESLDGEEGVGDTPDHPAFVLDDILRATGLQWAILTNGRIWRLYHRNTAGMLNTFYEVNLHEIILTSDFEAFKFFGSIFGKQGLTGGSSGNSVARGMLD